MKMKRIIVLFAAATLFLPSGCSKSEPLQTVKVTGTVKVDGIPMGGVSIIFNPVENNGTAAGGVTDATGAYSLTSGANTPGTGAVTGSFTPTFSKTELEQREPTASPEEEMAKYGGVPPKVFHLVPEKYGNVKTCGIDPVTVEKGKPNVFDFDLSSK